MRTSSRFILALHSLQLMTMRNIIICLAHVLASLARPINTYKMNHSVHPNNSLDPKKCVPGGAPPPHPLTESSISGLSGQTDCKGETFLYSGNGST